MLLDLGMAGYMGVFTLRELSISILERNRAMVIPFCQNSCPPIVGTVVNMAVTLQDEASCSQVWQSRFEIPGRDTQKWLNGDAGVSCRWRGFAVCHGDAGHTLSR